MLHLLKIIISLGALLALLMPSSIVGLIITAILFMFGAGIIVRTKKPKVSDKKSIAFSHILVTVITVAYLGFAFINRWLREPKALAVANLLNIPIQTLLLFISLVVMALSLYAVYAFLRAISHKISNNNRHHHWIIDLSLSLLFSIAVVAFAQSMNDIDVFSMGYTNFAWGVLIVLITVLLLYCLCGRIVLSISLGTSLFMLISTINIYVYKFRGRLFEPVDIFSAGTALSVLDNYSLFPLSRRLLLCWGIFIAGLIALSFLKYRIERRPTLVKRLILLAFCAVSSVSVFFHASGMTTYHWYNEGALFNGYVLDFVVKFREISVPKPDAYSAELIDRLAAQYATDDDTQEIISSDQPHIIVIMNESFADLRVTGDFSTNTEVMPFISSLKENTISGYALTSVFGGNTANAEYEFLTGNSMAWLSPNSVPYQQYIRSSTYSMVSHLKSQYNYKCVAMHPAYSGGWNRPAAYAHLEFDTCYFIEDFPQKNYLRAYISDQEMFEFLIETYESQKENLLFLYGVTMQNHGGYYYDGDNYTQHISLDGDNGKYTDVAQYLSLIHETDKAVEYLISYFQNVDEDVVILFFGDHQPRVNDAFYQSISGTNSPTLDEQQKRYVVPFFIWANYDIEEEYVDCTSLNYLSSYLYEAAGIALPPYNQFLREMEKSIPAINANGFYSLSNKCYLPFEQAGGEDLQWLNLYESLQYNSIFDKAHRNKTLFPVLEEPVS